MSVYWVVIADGARARFFRLDGARPFPQLTEEQDLVHPERQMRDGEIFSETNPGTRSGPSHRSQSFEDGRSNHDLELDRRFAGTVAKVLAERVDSEATVHAVVVAASVRLLPELRPKLDRLGLNKVKVYELAKDLTRQSPTEIHDYLANLEWIPERKRKGIG